MVQTLDPSTGGVAQAVSSLSAALARRGHELEIVTLDEKDPPWRSQRDLAIHSLGAGLTSYRFSRTLLPWLRQNGARFDRVIIHGLWQYLGFAAWRCFAGTAIPYYVFPHGMLDPWFRRTFPLKHLKKWLYWPWADYRVLRDARCVIFTADEERIQARKSFWFYRVRERVSALGIEDLAQDADDARAEFLRRFPEVRGTHILLFLGRIHPKKGCDLLIKALRGIDAGAGLSLVLAGPDQVGWTAGLQREIARLELRIPIVFTGMLEGVLKRGALAAADVFILPSHQENFGISVAEALSAGLPVLISNRVNTWREVQTDCAGYVDTDDVEGTTRLIQRWLHAPAKERSLMRSNARACFLRRFEISGAADSLLQILAESVPER